MKAFMLACTAITATLLIACPNGFEPVAAPGACAPLVVQRGGPCSQEVRDWVRIQGGGYSEPQAVSNASGGFEHAVIQPGTCVYTDACGVAWHVQGCYLGDGYWCP